MGLASTEELSSPFLAKGKKEKKASKRVASSPAPSGKRGRKKIPAQAFFIPLEEEESHDRVPLTQHQQTLDKEIVMYRNKEEPVMCLEAVSLFEGSSFKAGALSLASHYLLPQLHSTRQKCDV